MENTEKKIHIIITGGTIDSHWEGKLDTAVINEHSVLPDYFHNLILYAEIEFFELCLKDSRQVTPADLEKLLEIVEKSPFLKIVITHGTYTMPDTARFLNVNLKRNDQTIILTGSMVPLKGFEMSDAPFNLGYALAKAENLAPGIYLVMNGRVFTPEEVAKDLSGGKYYSVFDKTRSKNVG